MATEGATGLSTAAIERCIDNWETETQDGAEIPAAHAELAALVERAGRVTALEGTLLDETARRLWTERVLQDRHGYLVGWDWDVGPAVREHWTQVARERLGHARTVVTLAELLARRDADAGRAAALVAALRDCLPFLGGYQCDGMTEGDALIALERRIDALLADAGPGVAGARDETITALTKVAQIVVDCRDLPAGEFRDRWGVVTWADYYDKLTALADAALDALRDGGAGDKGAADGGAGGG